MSSTVRSAMFALLLFPLYSCTATAPDPAAQTLVETLASQHENLARLTVHAIPSGGKEFQAVASTLASKLGKSSDPEDLKAIKTGELVVLDEDGSFDVTVPIGMKNGSHTAAAGVTMKAGMDRNAAIVAAKAIAAEIDHGLMRATTKK